MVENVYEQRFQEIFWKYCKLIHVEQRNHLRNKLKGLGKSCDSDPWAIFGSGLFADQMCSQAELTSYENLYGILDNATEKIGTSFYGVPIKNPETVLEDGVKTVLNCTLLYSEEIKAQLHALDPAIEVIDLIQGEYTYNGIPLGCENKLDFDHILEEEEQSGVSGYFAPSCPQLYVLHNLYETSEVPEEKQFLLQGLIDCYVWMKDFISAFHWIDIYVATYGAGQYDLLKKDLELLLSDLKTALKARETKDILTVLLDNLPSGKFYDKDLFPYLNTLAEEGTCYKKAYSPGVYTSESMSAIWRNMPVTKLLEKGSREEIPFQSQLEKQKYTSGSSSFFKPLKITLPKESETRYFYQEGTLFQHFFMGLTLTQQYWSGMTFMASQTEKTFFFIHELVETHRPFLCGRFQNWQELNLYGTKNLETSPKIRQELLMKRLPELYSYVDEQSAFYLSMLGEQAVKVIFADHGKHIESVISCHDPIRSEWCFSDHFHVPLVLHGSGIEEKEITDVFSTQYLSLILAQLIGEDVEIPKQTYAQIGMLAIREPALRNVRLKYGFTYESDGFRVFLDEEYKMVRNSRGECRYFAMAHETEEIHDPALIAVIQERFGHLLTEDEYYTKD